MSAEVQADSASAVGSSSRDGISSFVFTFTGGQPADSPVATQVIKGSVKY